MLALAILCYILWFLVSGEFSILPIWFVTPTVVIAFGAMTALLDYKLSQRILITGFILWPLMWLALFPLVRLNVLN